MEVDQTSPLLAWAQYFQGKNMEELGNSLLWTTMELENTKMAVQEELRKRDEELIHLKNLLEKAIGERDEAQEKCQRLLLEKLIVQQRKNQIGPVSGVSSVEDEPRKGIEFNNGFSGSDCEESIVSSPVVDPIPTLQEELVGLPEKGKLLQAVMRAGPLLQTLLLAGPLPQWRHPPPPLQSFQIPPVTISSQPQLLHEQDSSLQSRDANCGRVNRKRVGYDLPSADTKFQRVLLQ